MHAIDQHHPHHLVRVRGGIQTRDQSPEGMADQDIWSLDVGRGEQGVEVRDLILRRARGGRGITGAAGDVRAVVAADPRERGDPVQNRRPEIAAVRVPRFQDDRRTPGARAGNSEPASANVEGSAACLGRDSRQAGERRHRQQADACQAVRRRVLRRDDHEKRCPVAPNQIAGDLLGRVRAGQPLVGEGAERLGELL